MAITFEIYRERRWQTAATLTPTDEATGIEGACRFEYTLEYAADFSGPNETVAAGLSCRYPADFQQHLLSHWPPFVLDVLPSGYGRTQWLEQLNLVDGRAADWPLLQHGTAYPPGNLRVAEAVDAKNTTALVPTADGDLVAMNRHPGFARDDILARSEAFTEYAFQHGIYAAGASDVQGVAPKLLLARDHAGAWHAEGRLSDDEVRTHWLVKRPRGERPDDRKVLRNEAEYMQVASQLGLRVHAALEWEADNLFVPRFDREVGSGDVQRYGMESLYSASGIAEYGARVSHETLCRTIETNCTEPATELLEYIQRDVLNVILGNKDNHGRNTALLRHESGHTALTPLFDFAPMYLDPEGIARVCRWSDNAETAGNPQWSQVIEKFPDHEDVFREALRDFGRRLEPLADIMQDCGVDDDIIEQRSRSMAEHIPQLLAL